MLKAITCILGIFLLMGMTGRWTREARAQSIGDEISRTSSKDMTILDGSRQVDSDGFVLLDVKLDRVIVVKDNNPFDPRDPVKNKDGRLEDGTGTGPGTTPGTVANVCFPIDPIPVTEPYAVGMGLVGVGAFLLDPVTGRGGLQSGSETCNEGLVALYFDTSGRPEICISAPFPPFSEWSPVTLPAGSPCNLAADTNHTFRVRHISGATFDIVVRGQSSINGTMTVVSVTRIS